jgi:hypothetical protein
VGGAGRFVQAKFIGRQDAAEFGENGLAAFLHAAWIKSKSRFKSKQEAFKPGKSFWDTGRSLPTTPDSQAPK